MKDNFSKQAALYARYRPVYPQELFDFILQHVSTKQYLWDCATGNGQTAKALASHFEKVFATDISQQQLDNAAQESNIIYSLQPAEQTNFDDDQFDLVTVSQALHWFHFDRFYKELHRVARLGGWFAAWMYGGITISPEIDLLKRYLHDVILGEYWLTENRRVDDNYATIPFPLKEIDCPTFYMSFEWSLEQLEGYFNTWSALQKFIATRGYNPVAETIDKIKQHWTREKMTISFPLQLRMGQVLK